MDPLVKVAQFVGVGTDTFFNSRGGVGRYFFEEFTNVGNLNGCVLWACPHMGIVDEFRFRFAFFWRERPLASLDLLGASFDRVGQRRFIGVDLLVAYFFAGQNTAGNAHCSLKAGCFNRAVKEMLKVKSGYKEHVSLR